MTHIEYAKKLGINLNSAQIEILNLIEKQGNENLIISFPRISGRQMLYNLIERKKGYEQGIADERERIVNLLKEKAWVEEDNAYLKFDAVLVPLQRLLDEIVRGGENE